MSRSEREAFLAALHVGVLSVERTDGPPLVSPVWYRYQPGGAVEITTEAESVKAGLVRAAGRASLCVQREEYPYAYVTVEGPVALGAAPDDLRVAIATRYLGADMGAAYVASSSSDDSRLALTPERWRTVDYAKLDGAS